MYSRRQKNVSIFFRRTFKVRTVPFPYYGKKTVRERLKNGVKTVVVRSENGQRTISGSAVILGSSLEYSSSLFRRAERVAATQWSHRGGASAARRYPSPPLSPW